MRNEKLDVSIYEYLDESPEDIKPLSPIEDTRISIIKMVQSFFEINDESDSLQDYLNSLDELNSEIDNFIETNLSSLKNSKSSFR